MKLFRTPRAPYGFTIIEILVVITIIGILSTLIVVGYNGYQKRAAETTMQTDLAEASDIIEVFAIRNNNKYPQATEIDNLQDSKGLPQGDGRVIAYYSNSDNTKYCAEIRHINHDSRFYITDEKNTPQAGECEEFVESTPPPPVPPEPEPEPLPEVCDSYSVGNNGPGGGRIVYVAPEPQEWGCYLEVALNTSGGGWWGSSMGSSEQTFRWGCQGVNIPGARNTGIGRGKANTQAIISNCNENTAAHQSRRFKGGGKTDWYLPNEQEMDYIIRYNNGNPRQERSNPLRLKEGAGWMAASYWTSYQRNATQGANYVTHGSRCDFWVICTTVGYDSQENKNNTAWKYVRPVRVF